MKNPFILFRARWDGIRAPIIALAVMALPALLYACGGGNNSAARRGDDKRGGINFLPALCVIFFLGFLTACGSKHNPFKVDVPEINIPNIPPFLPTRPTQPARINLTDTNIGALHISDSDRSFYFLVARPSGESGVFQGQTVALTARSVTQLTVTGMQFPQIRRSGWSGSLNDLEPLTLAGTIAILAERRGQVFVDTRTDITSFAQLCPAVWLTAYIDRTFANTPCSPASGSSYSPDMGRAVHAAMADSFRRGVGIGESGFAFSGRYDGDNRAAGFAYDLGGYALRADYIRLPSRQDGEVWLDTYRFGALTRVNDEVQFFAGVDSYKNAIIAVDATGEKLHRFGFAIGDGYAVKYEYRLDL